MGTYEAYPGVAQTVHRFEKLFARWIMAGCPTQQGFYAEIPGEGFQGMEQRKDSGLPCIYYGTGVEWSVRNFPTEGFLGMRLAADEVARLETAARQRGLDAKLVDFGGGKVSILFLAPTVEAFRSCALGLWLQSAKSRAVMAIPLAQKFYDLRLFSDIDQELSRLGRRSAYWWMGSFTCQGVANGFTFRQLGYRDLKNEEELIAFMLAAHCRCMWKVRPEDLMTSALRWYLDVQYVDGSPVICDHPFYDPPKPKPAPQPLKDFFID